MFTRDADFLSVGVSHNRVDLKQVKFGDELARIGFLGDCPATYEANKLSAHFEVHIEQGPVLEAENAPVGVVFGVQGIFSLNLPRKNSQSSRTLHSNELGKCRASRTGTTLWYNANGQENRHSSRCS